MASYNIPNPRPNNFVADNHGLGVGDKSNVAREFFAKIYPSITNSGNQVPGGGSGLGNVGRWKQDWTLSDMLENMTETIMSDVDRILFVTETWYFEVCPVGQCEALHMNWMTTLFRPTMPTPTPPRSRVRLLDVQQIEGATSMTRFGLGFEVDDETLKGSVPRGVDWYFQRLAMLAESIIEGDKFAILSAIMTSGRHQPVYFNSKEIYQQRNLQGVCELQFRLFMSAVKLELPFEVWDGEMEVDMRAHGVPTSRIVYIMYEHTARYMSVMKDSYTKYYLAGPKGPEIPTDGSQAFQTVLGHKVYMSRPFVSEKGYIDIMGSESTVGLYYHAQDPFRNRPGLPFSRAARTVRLTDVSTRTMGELTIDQLDAASGRWNLGEGGNGELNTFLAPDNWAHAPAEQRRKQMPKRDLFHDIGPDGSIRVCKVWGSVPEFNVSPKSVFDIVESYCANLGDDRVTRFHNAIDAFMEFVGKCEAASITRAGAPNALSADATALFTAIAGLPTATRPATMRGCAPVMGTLVETARDSSNGFLPTNAAVNAAINGNTSGWELPPGFGRLAGARYLVANRGALANLNQSLLDKAAEFLRVFREMASVLGPVFAYSYGIDAKYATSDMWYADSTDVIADCLLLPRRLPVWVFGDGTAAPAAQTGAATFAQLYQRFSDAVTAKFANITAAVSKGYVNQFDLAAGSPSAIEKYAKASMVLAVMTMFTAEDQAKNFGQAAAAANILAAGEGGVRAPLGMTVEQARDAILSIIKSAAFSARGTHAGATAIQKQLNELIDAVLETKALRTSPHVGDINGYHRTPLLFGPSQLSELAAVLRAGTNDAGVLVSRDALIDYVEVPGGIISMSADVASGNAARMPVCARPLTLREPLTDPRQLSAVQAVLQIRQHLASQGVSVPSGSATGTMTRSALAHTLTTQAGSLGAPTVGSRSKLQQYVSGGGAPAAPAASPAGAPQQQQQQSPIFGCLDPDMVDICNKPFRDLWDSAAVLGRNSLHTLLMRLYALTPTNYYKSVQLWWQHNFRAPVEYAIVRTLHNRTYPIIRMVPGGDTMRLLRSHDHMHWGTDQKTGIFGLAYTYYTGIAMLRPDWIHKYYGVDTAGYMHGMGTQMRDVRLHANNPWADQGYGRDLLVCAVPYGVRNLPSAWNPGGFVSVVNDRIVGVPSLTWDLGMETFENWHKRFSQHPSMQSKVPTQSQLLAGFGIEPSQVMPVYAEDTLFFNDPVTGRFDRVRQSRGPIPTKYATPDLRWILDGVAEKANLLGSNVTDL